MVEEVGPIETDLVLDTPDLVRLVLADYPLPWRGAHGPAHWARVRDNGLMLAASTGADVAVVRLFALLHDARRVNEGDDPDHGPRAARLAGSLRGRGFDLPDGPFELLRSALAGHTHERFHPDATVQTCWDADRLDLGRVGMMPHPRWLGTTPARSRGTIAQAHGRATFRVVPDWIAAEWGIDPARLGPIRRGP